ncbi:hypothetical protein NM688_g5251 [Phlebia brevispora]|uniref:Uncharacterized protein n=1 Tax=Phlebia brevispora TaxID=194682 RepID=A0ACC1SY70_9APHY|nr:hypothetical protein NM688_g5251 [Phlebia brevispora]
MAFMPKPDDTTNRNRNIVQDANPWTKIEQTVRPVHEEKVKDSTANLDALLVFAGLYSAILTAFLIESYKNLQPDDKKDLLRQIAGQTANYSFSGGYLNSTYNPSLVKPFEAAISDIRVNVCWFASLILSLSTASYAILVRQWLREYITIDRTAPEERVRIWHYRSKGLEDWGLFEITALLPVLLQIAFALFFVGLCFFTVAVHSSIRTTSIVGVSGWAVLFIFSILAPAVSPRCPYRTTFLKSALALIRPYVRHIIIPSVQSVVLLPVAMLSYVLRVLRLLGTIVQLRGLYSRIRQAWMWISSHFPAFIVRARERDEELSTSSASASDSRLSYDSSDHMRIGVLEYLFENTLPEDRAVLEETEIRSTDTKDLAILHSIDSSFLDDSLLLNMRDDLTRRPRPVREVLQFMTAVVRSRAGILPPLTEEPSQPKFPWPWALSPSVRATLVDIVADAMLHQFPLISLQQWELYTDLEGTDSTWQDAWILIMTLITPQRIGLSEGVNRIFQRLLEHESWLSSRAFTNQMVVMSRRDSGWCIHCISCIASISQAIEPGNAAKCLEWIVCDAFVDRVIMQNYDPGDVFPGLLDLHRRKYPKPYLIGPTPSDAVIILDAACVILHNYQVQHATIHINAIPRLERWLPDVDLAQPYIPAMDGIRLDDVLKNFFLVPQFTYAFLDFLSENNEHLLSSTRAPNIFLPHLVSQSYGHIGNDTAITVSEICTEYFKHQIETGALTFLSTLRLCYLAYMVPANSFEPSLNLFRNVLACIREVYVADNDNCRTSWRDHTDLCLAASNILSFQDEHDANQQHRYRLYRTQNTTVEEETEMYMAWCKNFDANKVCIPDEMVDVLRHFVCDSNNADEHGRKFWRVRRVEDLIKKNGNTTPSFNATSGSADGSATTAAPMPVLEVPRMRRRAKSLFESFDSGFEYLSSSHMSAPTLPHVSRVDSAVAAEARFGQALPVTTATASTSMAVPTGDFHVDHGHGSARPNVQTESFDSSHSLPMPSPSRLQFVPELHTAASKTKRTVLASAEPDALPTNEPISPLQSERPGSESTISSPPSPASKVFRGTEATVSLSPDGGQEELGPNVLSVPISASGASSGKRGIAAAGVSPPEEDHVTIHLSPNPGGAQDDATSVFYRTSSSAISQAIATLELRPVSQSLVHTSALSTADNNMAFMPKPDDNTNRTKDSAQDANPWLKIEQAVRPVDEEKVKDSTANLDALLVFAGLYSAILTAFLIESYKNLQPDDKKDLLRQIAGQTANYSFSGGYLNSTYNPSLVKPFEAAISDIRVNVCWFASLILSLSTASFGILVRQWLREYITIDRTAPEERMRIWHYRSKGLDDWYLFEITALLPVLLQAAFALFFVGLCFFTAAVHSSIGTTSIVGVSGWAVLFIFSILAPAVSARCPYKTTFLKTSFAFIRPHVRTKVIALVLSVILLPTGLLHLATSVSRVISAKLQLVQVCDRLRTVWENIVSTARAAMGSCIHLDHSQVPASGAQQQGALQPTLTAPSPNSQQFPEFSDYMCVNVLRHVFNNNMLVEVPEAPHAHEEAEIRSTDHNDLAVFANIDSLFLDDILLSNMREDLKRRPRPVAEVLPFVATLVRSRGGVLLPIGDEASVPKLPWPWALSQRVRDTLMDILADSMLHELPRIFPRRWDLLADAEGPDQSWIDAFVLIMALTSPQGSVGSETVNSLLQQLSSCEAWSALRIFTNQMVAMSKQDSDWASHCLSKIAFTWQASDPTNAARVLSWIVCNSFVDRYIYVSADAFLRLLKRVEDPNPDFIAPTPHDVLVIFDIACVILHTYQAKHSTGEGQIKQFDDGIDRLLEFVLEAIPKLQKWLPRVDLLRPYIPAAEGIDLEHVLTEFFINPQFTYAYLNFFSRHSQYLSPDNAPEIFSLYIIVDQIYDIENPTAISILNACATFFEEHTGTRGVDLVGILRLCFLIYRVRTDDDREVLDCWHKVFHNAGACIDAMVDSRHKVDEDSTCQAGHTDLCSAASSLLRYQDEDNNDQTDFYRDSITSNPTVEEEAEEYLEWCNNFDVNQSQIPDKMVNRLRRFVCAAQTVNEDGWKFWRVRRLEDLEKKQSNNTSPNMLSDPANGSACVAATVPIAKFPTARRRAKSLFETFNSDFEYMHLDPLAPHHVPHADSTAVAEARPHTLIPPGTAATAPMSTSATTKDAHEHSQGTFYAEKKSSRPSHSPPIQSFSHKQPATGSAEPHVATHSPEMPALLPTEQGSDPSQQPAAAPRCSDEALPAAEPAIQISIGRPEF